MGLRTDLAEEDVMQVPRPRAEVDELDPPTPDWAVRIQRARAAWRAGRRLRRERDRRMFGVDSGSKP